MGTQKQSNNTALRDVTITDCLMENVYKYGSDKAYVENRIFWTWQQINAASEAAADELRREGIQKGEHIGLCAYNSINCIIIFFALMKLQAVAVLINSFQLIPEIKQALSLSDVKLLCFGSCAALEKSPTFIDQLKNDETCPAKHFFNFLNKKYFDYIQENNSADSKYKRSNPSETNNVACILFTSGSTGKPKAVCLTHRNIINAAYEPKSLELNKNDNTLLALPLFHCFGLIITFLAALVRQSMLCIPSQIRTTDILETIDTYRCTYMTAVPTLVLALIDNSGFTEYHTEQLRAILLGGSAASKIQITAIRKTFPNIHILMSYGQTEASPGISCTKYDDTFEHITETAGLPLDNVTVKIHEPKNNKKLPDGQTGEIVVKGYNVMKGYYKLPPAMQAVDADGWLHTGDMGFIDSIDGYIHITGRIKELIIRAGENIMPLEIENVICSDSNILQCKVIGIPDDFWGEQVIACITLKTPETYNEANLHTMLKNKLSLYKIPARILVLESFPLLPNGKIDVIALKTEAAKRLSIF